MEEQKATIYVGGLSFDSDEQALHKFFLRYGEVKSTKVGHRQQIRPLPLCSWPVAGHCTLGGSNPLLDTLHAGGGRP